MITMSIEMLNSTASVMVSLVALIVSIIALVYTAKTYLLKSDTVASLSKKVHPKLVF
jgi:hypothetical protein